MNKKNIAIITGASSGYGKEFVKALDKENQYDEIWVIARREERLIALQDECKNKIVPVALDLTKSSSIDVIKDKLQTEDVEVKTLVNASGFAYFNHFCKLEDHDWQKIIDLNVKALVSLTHLALKYMHEGGQIYNICSTSAFQPVPYIGVYGATKSFVLNFSRSLNMELKQQKIKVLAVCPHWTKTEFFDTAVLDDSVITYYNTFNIAKDVVNTALKNMKKGKDISLCSFKVKFQVFLVKYVPAYFVMRIWCKQQKKQYK